MSVRLCLPYDRFLQVVDVKIQEFQQKCSISTDDIKMFYTSSEVFYMHGHTVILTLHQITDTSYDKSGTCCLEFRSCKCSKISNTFFSLCSQIKCWFSGLEFTKCLSG